MNKIFNLRNFFINLNTSEVIAFILISLIPFFLITGPFLTDLAITLISLIFLFNFFNLKKYKYFQNRFVYFFLFFYAVLILSSFFSKDIFISLKPSFFYIRFLLFSLCIWFILDKNENLINSIFWVLFFCISFLLFDSFFQFIFKVNLFGMPLIGSRVSSFFGDELVLGSYLVRLYPLFFSFLILINKKKNCVLLNYISFLIFILIDILIILSGERTAIFYLNLSAIFLILCLEGKFRKIRIISFLISIIT